MDMSGFLGPIFGPELILGLLLVLAPGWFTILKPAWFGLRQMLGRVDPLAEAMAGVRTSLADLFVDIKGLAEATDTQRIMDIGGRGLKDMFTGKGAAVLQDTKILLQNGVETYSAFQERWAPQLKAMQELPAHQAIVVVHGFWQWLRSDKVVMVVAAAGRRLGYADNVLAEREGKVQKVIHEHAPSLAFGFWYGLYSVLAFQFLLLEFSYAFGRPRPLFWIAAGLAAFNFIKLALFLRDLLPYWPVRRELLEIASMAGVPSLPRYAGRLLVGEGLGILTMLLLVLRFLALGEALQQPGNILSGLHQALTWVLATYLRIVRGLF